MAVCTFFGHSDTPNEIFKSLKAQIISLITDKGVNKFYIGNHGHFDCLARKVLNELKQEYTHINYLVVLAYMPTKTSDSDLFDYSTAIYPEGLETVPPKFAIDYRNKWMIRNSDYVITYVTKIVGGAYKYKEIAKRKNKIIIELSE
ncbi:MAG: hypothetical protein IKU84_06125 [Clostridia bacterium]|nr:hypothetical protein [Clostridia bacterium]